MTIQLRVQPRARRTELERTAEGALKAADVGCVVYYDTPHHLQPVFADLGYKEGSLPETERASRECLALPMYPTLPEADQHALIAALEAASA